MAKRKSEKAPHELFVCGCQLANGRWDLQAYGSLQEVPEDEANGQIFLYEMTATRTFRVQKILEA